MIDALGTLLPGRGPLFAQSAGSFWLPGQESTAAKVMDPVFYMILAICCVFFALVIGLMVFFVIRYRRRPGVGPEESPSHHTALEIGWTLIPLAVVSVIFYQSFIAYMEMQTAPQECYEIRVTAKQWEWFFSYPNGHVDGDLHVPVDEPVKLIMTSEDVLHGLWIPAFRVKMDLVPGRYTSAWFRAVRPDTYELLCTEYCGASELKPMEGHFSMLAAVVVHPPGEFDKWLEGADDYLRSLPPVEAGKQLFTSKGCANCHSVKGVAGTGPPLNGIFGETHAMIGGDKVLVDDNYIRESILDPKKRIRAGYQPTMSTFRGLVSDEEITWLIEYFKTLE